MGCEEHESQGAARSRPVHKRTGTQRLGSGLENHEKGFRSRKTRFKSFDISSVLPPKPYLNVGTPISRDY